MQYSKPSSRTPDLAPSANGDETPAAKTDGKPDDPPSVDDTRARILADSGLESQVDPSGVFSNWDTEAFSGPDESGPKGHWGKPPKDNFVRVHPTWRRDVGIVDCKRSIGLDAEYIVTPRVVQALVDLDEDVSKARVFALMDRDGGLIFWAVKFGLATDLVEQKSSDYVKSANAAIERGKSEWIKIVWRIKAYRTRPARGDLPEPQWPEDLTAIFIETVKERLIDDPKDPVIQKYIGEIH
jgi:hypothetical protein